MYSKHGFFFLFGCIFMAGMREDEEGRGGGGSKIKNDGVCASGKRACVKRLLGMVFFLQVSVLGVCGGCQWPSWFFFFFLGWWWWWCLRSFGGLWFGGAYIAVYRLPSLTTYKKRCLGGGEHEIKNFI